MTLPALSAAVLTSKAPVVCPCGIVICAAHHANWGLLLRSSTTAPPAPAARDSTTVPRTVPPAVTEVGFRLSWLTVGVFCICSAACKARCKFSRPLPSPIPPNQNGWTGSALFSSAMRSC
jgi:hypothetical protein